MGRIFLSWGMPPEKPNRLDLVSGCRGFVRLLLNLAAQQARAHAQIAFIGLQQKGIQTTTMFDRPDRSSRHTQAIALSECIGNQRDIAQIWQKLPLRLVVGVADIVAGLNAFACQFACARHGTPISLRLQEDTSSHRLPAAHLQALIGKLRFYSHVERTRQAKHAIPVAVAGKTGLENLFGPEKPQNAGNVTVSFHFRN
jgi:hypothetical protein